MEGNSDTNMNNEIVNNTQQIELEIQSKTTIPITPPQENNNKYKCCCCNLRIGMILLTILWALLYLAFAVIFGFGSLITILMIFGLITGVLTSKRDATAANATGFQVCNIIWLLVLILISAGVWYVYSNPDDFLLGEGYMIPGEVDGIDDECYQIFDEPYGATHSDLRRKYFRMSIQGDYRHPDKGGEEEMFKKLSGCWEIFDDEEKRRHYDDLISRGVHEGQKQASYADYLSMLKMHIVYPTMAIIWVYFVFKINQFRKSLVSRQ